MFIKLFNTVIFLIFIIFFVIIFKYYSSSKNMNEKNQNRLNINEIIKEKISDLPVLPNDTNNIIEFNNSLEDTTNEKKRSFWELIKDK
tara:strand:+ start:165 stop:428 length:264 start_codon:yes stop_codon:yes gene_type:complete